MPTAGRRRVVPAGDSGSTGRTRALAGPTPNLGALTEAGVRFENSWGSPHGSPFRASALAGFGHLAGTTGSLGKTNGYDACEKRVDGVCERGCGGRAEGSAPSAVSV